MARRIIETGWGGTKIDQLTSKRADLNSQEITIDDTATAHVMAHLKAHDEVVKLKYIITEEFNGALKLGNADDAEAYIADAIFPKSGSGVLVINKILTAAADIKLTVSGCTTGAGWFKLIWEV